MINVQTCKTHPPPYFIGFTACTNIKIPEDSGWKTQVPRKSEIRGNWRSKVRWFLSFYWHKIFIGLSGDIICKDVLMLGLFISHRLEKQRKKLHKEYLLKDMRDEKDEKKVTVRFHLSSILAYHSHIFCFLHCNHYLSYKIH